MGGEELCRGALACVAAPLSAQGTSMPAAFTPDLSTAAKLTCSGLYPVGTEAWLALRGKRKQRRQARSLALHAASCRNGVGTRGIASRCGSVEQSGQVGARCLYRSLEHGSKAHLQRTLSISHAGAARQAHAKAASTSSSLMGGEELCAVEPSHVLQLR